MWFWKVSWGKWDAIWTYSPITTAAISADSRPVLYHCVDNIAAQPLMPAEAIDRYETELVHTADLIFSTAPDLTDRLRRMGADNVIEHTNVVDFEHFGKEYRMRDDSESSRRPSPRTIGFVGALSRYKVDLQLLRRVAEKYPDADVVLIGQIGEGQPGETLAELKDLTNVKLLGPKPYSELPGIISTFDVALLPVPINPYTRSMFPMKFFEYLACGIPVVSTRIPALEKFGDSAFIADTDEQFVEYVKVASTVSRNWRDNARTLASKYTYRERTAEMCCMLDRLLASKSGSVDGTL
ncbi:glycosyltransferase [Arthrobacter bambusae]|uniref:glycosyltransferase n=2 Tax=Arthrobacter TaxID=1663 RepID=UPI001F50E32B|nr:glycosyltransferase [Arthrobacter bambusae]MCI0139982.1 glycosyltransferase [Arthrobacter bambusae]